MLADEVIAGEHECLHATQSLAHPRVSPSSGSRHEPLAAFSPRAGRKNPRGRYPAAFFRRAAPASLSAAGFAVFRPNTGRRNRPV
jgi:hypothetical protein